MIRAIGIDELDALEETAREFSRASRFIGAFSLARFRELWTQLLGSGAGVIFADESGGEINGMIGGIVHQEFYGTRIVAEEFFWFVRADSRGGGVALYRRFERWARERGAVKIHMVHLFDSMPEKVAKFYLRTGFEPVEMRYQKDLTDVRDIRVFDDFLPDPAAYRAKALEREYKTIDFPAANTAFHGLANPLDPEVPLRIADMFPGATPTLSVLRRSPHGQAEPHYIHSDIDMGDWTALLYLNPEPPDGDGTAFWRYRPTGECGHKTPHLRSAEGMTPDPALWERWYLARAKFNRLVVFRSMLFHSRAIFENWGAGDDARLTQVTFGKGDILP